MKEHDIKLTLQETEQLCRLYMDCRLTVLEETELQYVLEKLPYSSPCIDEVRTLMGISFPVLTESPSKIKSGWFNGKVVTDIAASVAILFTVGLGMFYSERNSPDSSLHSDDHIYVAAYRHGERLNGNEAMAATNMAMAKADSLMQYAVLTERDYMLKANNIISATINN